MIPKTKACQLKSENNLGKSCITNHVDLAELNPTNGNN